MGSWHKKFNLASIITLSVLYGPPLFSYHSLIALNAVAVVPYTFLFCVALYRAWLRTKHKRMSLNIF